MHSGRFTVATIQPPYPQDDSLENHLSMREKGFRYLQMAVQNICSVVCLPEYFNCIGLPPARMKEMAYSSSGLKEKVANLAAGNKVYILLPLLEERKGHLFNTCHLFGTNGRIIFSYDKIHLTKCEKEELELTPGETLSTCDTPLGKIGIATCYDIYFPELFRSFFQQGVQLILFPSLQRSENPEAVLSTISTRAMDCCSYLVRSAYGTAENAAWRPGLSYGYSCVVHPDGTILGNAGHYEGLALASINPAIRWRKPRCHGYSEQDVREFLLQDQRIDLLK